MAHSIAPKSKFGSPVTYAAPPQASIAAHNAGYLITGGVQLTTTPFTHLRYLIFERIPAMNQAIPLANPGLTLDGVIVERPRPKEAIITLLLEPPALS